MDGSLESGGNALSPFGLNKTISSTNIKTDEIAKVMILRL
jgi:hypothetical protein